MALLLLGSWGWGAAFVAGAVRARLATRHQAQLEVPLQMALGVALFLLVGGVLVAIDAARFDVLIAWHVVGVALLLPRGRRLLENLATRRGVFNPGAVVGALVGAVVSVVVVLVSLGVAIGIPFYNVDDDDAGYIYLARRLLDTGGLVDPFNTRRLTAYGGSTLYQSLFLNVSGNSAVRGFEWTFAALVLIVVAVRTTRRRWWAVGAFVIGAGVLVGAGSGPLQNLSPTLSAAALSLGAYQFLGRMRAAPPSDDRFPALCVGLLLGGVLALRFYFLIPVALATVLVILATSRRPWRTLALCVGTAVASVLGWAVALYRSSGTPLFPLLAGNYDTRFPVGPDPLRSGIHSYLSRLWSAAEGYHVGLVAVAALGVGVILLLVRPARPVSGVVLIGAGLGCALQLVLYSVTLSGFAAFELDRFAAPSTLACGLLVIDALWPLRPDASTPAPRPSWRAVRARLSPRALGVGAGTVVVLAASTLLVFDVPPAAAWDAVVGETHLGTDVLTGTTGFTDRYASVRSQYARLNAAIPAGAKVLSAVDDPALLQFSRYSVATLDVAGSASPPPHMPFFSGAGAKVRYLRSQGYDYIVAASSETRGLYQVRTWEYDLVSDNYNYRAWAPYFIDWSRFVNSIEHDPAYRVTAVGSIDVIDIGSR